MTIGIFDSGIGGMSVLKAVRFLLPSENLIYLSDRTHFPYGNKRKEQIVQYSLENTATLVKLGAKAIVIACHTASALAATEVREEFDLPIVDMVTPTLSWAGKYEGVALTTENTAYSGVYHKKVKCLPCPTFASLVENRRSQSEEAKETIRLHLDKLKDTPVVILGCTHYSYLSTLIAECLPETKILDPAWLVAKEVKKILTEMQKLNGRKPKGGKQNLSHSL